MRFLAVAISSFIAFPHSPILVWALNAGGIMRIRSTLRAMATAMVASLLLAALATSAVAGENPGKDDQDNKGAKEKVTICHRTNSTAHPYTSVTTDLSEDHFDKHTGPLWNPTLKKWGDVIPPSEAHPDGSEAYQDLIELGMDPDAFIAQGCSTPLS